MKNNIYITSRLFEEVRKTDKNLENFNSAMKILRAILDEWHENIHSRSRLDNYFCGKYLPDIVLGTKEEVFKERRKLKRVFRGTNIKDLNEIRLRLMNLISSSNYCFKLDQIESELDKIRSYCSSDENYMKEDKYIRYAFYAPNKCFHELDLSSSLEIRTLNDNEFSSDKFLDNPMDDFTGYFESIKDLYENVVASFINGTISKDRFVMMPYDLITPKSDDFFKLYFTPKFYHALYHELFHFLLSDFFRSDGYKAEGRDVNNINEGLPEIYSEICFDEFMESKLFRKTQQLRTERKHSLTHKNRFKKEYMDHLSTKHPYHEFYKYADEKVKPRNHQVFLQFTMELIMKGYHSKNGEFLKCGEFTPEWENIFLETCDRFKGDAYL